MPGMQRMHTNLMGAPSNRLGLDQGGEFTKAAQHTKDRQRLLALIIDLNHALTGTQGILQQWRIDLLLSGSPVPAHQRHIALVHAITAQFGVQMAQHAALFGDH